ncbi:MAG TPA: hypothetical protein VN827_09635 [Chthoniobacterales bacterium]|jgi:hypothetical protein|nr:hypothetical protein [Chthoniobacterales bacterium]
MSFIRTGLREIGLKIRRQRTRMILRHEKRLLQKSEIALGREGTSRAANFPELRNEIVALKKLEQEQKEVALRIAQIEEGIKKIETQRQANAKEQSEAMARLEAEKKPISERRNDAKRAAELCEREVNAVERRIHENDATDQDLLKKLSELQALTPPPADLETQTAGINARRVRLPEERVELVRARLGSTDASRIAKEKLVAAEEELSAIEKNIAKVRGDYETRDKGFADSIRAQQDAVLEAKQRLQVVEERKNPAYLNIGRHLASQGIAPPNAPHLLDDVRKHRVAVDRHQQHNDELALLSQSIDKQELRQFYFSVVSVIALLAIILPLVAKSPRKREWLPQQTEAILSINTEQFERDDLPKRWHKEQADVWQNVWNGLIGPAARVPALNLSRDMLRITRATTSSDSGTVREFILIENRSDVSQIIRSIQSDKEFYKRTVSGLPVWEKSDLALARVGPSTLAVGSSSEVDELVRVRLGIDLDLKITGQLLDQFQALDRESALRLISRSPPDLPRMFHPIFAPELLENSQLLGFALTLQNPVKARLFLKMKSPELASELARNLHNEPQRWLRLQDSNLVLYAQPPEVTRQAANLELHFSVPDETARLLLQRIAKSDIAGSVAGD